MEIGKNIKKYRTENKITQTELGKAIGRSLSVIQKYEAGDIIPPIGVIEKIAQVLNVNPTDIYLNEEVANSENKYNELLKRYENIVNENNHLKAKLKETLEEYLMLKQLVKYQQDQINKFNH